MARAHSLFGQVSLGNASRFDGSDGVARRAGRYLRDQPNTALACLFRCASRWPECIVAARSVLSGRLLQRLFAEIAPPKTPWADRKSRAVLGAGDHGESRNLFAPLADHSVPPCRLFKAVVTEQKLDVDGVLGQPISRSEQLAYRYFVDVDSSRAQGMHGHGS